MPSSGKRRGPHHNSLARAMESGDAGSVREWGLRDLGDAVYDFLWKVDNTWPHETRPAGPARLTEVDFVSAQRELASPLDAWSWLAHQSGPEVAEAERFASAIRMLLDRVEVRDGTEAVVVARSIWEQVQAIGYA